MYELFDSAKLLCDPDYFARILSLACITPESSLYSFRRNKICEIKTLQIVRDFFSSCKRKCFCKKIINFSQKENPNPCWFRVPKSIEIKGEDTEDTKEGDTKEKKIYINCRERFSYVFSYEIS